MSSIRHRVSPFLLRHYHHSMQSETRILDGRKLGQVLQKTSFLPRINAIKQKHDIVPGLAIVQVGAQPDSSVYIKMKLKQAKELGIRYEHIQLDSGNCLESAVLELVQGLNQRTDIHGILVQLPLPDNISPARIMDAIDPTKDVDGFHTSNAGQLSKRHGRPLFVPCTAKGVLYLIQCALSQSDLDYNHTEWPAPDLSGLTAVVVGRSDIVCAPVAQLLLKQNATVIICHSKTKDPKSLIHLADILVVAIGKPKYISGDWIRQGTLVIDVGINATSEGMVGDVDFESMLGKAGAITPVPGGVGPLTVAMLMDNVIASAERFSSLKKAE